VAIPSEWTEWEVDVVAAAAADDDDGGAQEP